MERPLHASVRGGPPHEGAPVRIRFALAPREGCSPVTFAGLLAGFAAGLPDGLHAELVLARNGEAVELELAVLGSGHPARTADREVRVREELGTLADLAGFACVPRHGPSPAPLPGRTRIVPRPLPGPVDLRTPGPRAVPAGAEAPLVAPPVRSPVFLLPPDRLLAELHRRCGSFRLRFVLAPFRPDARLLRTLQAGADGRTAAARTLVDELTRVGGYRLVLEVESEHPLPRMLRDQLARAVFGLPMAEDGVEAVGPDLRGLFPADVPVPLPHAHLLAAVPHPVGATVGRDDLGRPVVLSDAERRRHVYLVGATGTGKSTLLARLLLADIARGHGVVLVDPHGDLARELVAFLPPERHGDLVVLDFDMREAVPVLDLLDLSEIDPVQGEEFLISDLLEIFERLYDMRVVGGPVFETYFRHAVGLLLDRAEDGTTLADLPRLFADEAFRHRLLKRCRRPETIRFWRDIAERTSGDWQLANFAPYIISKLNRFVDHPWLRAVLGRRGGTMHFGRWLREGRIVLVRLPKGTLGAFDCRMLGMLLLGRLWQVVLGRAREDPERRRPVTLAVDEFHNFYTDVFTSALAEGRKFGLSLLLAGQTLGQSGPELRDVVLGNVGTLVTFRLGPTDALLLSPWFAPAYGTGDLLDLPDHTALVRRLAGGVPPERARTLPPPEPAIDPATALQLWATEAVRRARPREPSLAPDRDRA